MSVLFVNVVRPTGHSVNKNNWPYFFIIEKHIHTHSFREAFMVMECGNSLVYMGMLLCEKLPWYLTHKSMCHTCVSFGSWCMPLPTECRTFDLYI